MPEAWSWINKIYQYALKFSENANAPELTISPPQPLLDLQYNPRDQHILVGGLMNGQVSYKYIYMI